MLLVLGKAVTLVRIQLLHPFRTFWASLEEESLQPFRRLVLDIANSSDISAIPLMTKIRAFSFEIWLNGRAAD